MTKIKRICTFVLSLFFLSACTQSVGLLGELHSDYHKTLNRQSRQKKLYGLERVPYMTHIIYKNETLRTAYVNEYAKKYRLSEKERAELLEKEIQTAKDFEEFIIFHYENDRQRSRSDSSSLDRWKIRLHFSEDFSAEPHSMSNLSGDASVLQYFYPKMTPWSKNYVVKFKKIPEPTSQIILSMDSVDANLDFKWDI